MYLITARYLIGLRLVNLASYALSLASDVMVDSRPSKVRSSWSGGPCRALHCHLADLAVVVVVACHLRQEQRVELLVLQARLLWAGQNAKGALSRLESVIDLDSGCTEAWAVRGDIYLAQGQLADARVCLCV